MTTSNPVPDRFSAHGPLVLRVTLGVVFLAHAYAKARIFTFAGTEQFFEANHFPGWMTYPVFAAELIGGIALVVGVKVRWTAGVLGVVMLGALKTHLGNGWMFTGAGGGWEYPAVLIAALVAQAAMGAGAFALAFPKLAIGARAASRG